MASNANLSMARRLAAKGRPLNAEGLSAISRKRIVKGIWIPGDKLEACFAYYLAQPPNVSNDH